MHRSTILVALTSAALAPAVIAAGACSFPTILIAGDASGSGGGATSSASAITTGFTSGTGGATVTTSTAASSTGASSGGSTAASSTGAGCTLDVDDDKFLSWMCGGPDCADSDKLAFPDAGFAPGHVVGPTKSNLMYDFNCDGKEEALIPVCALGCDPDAGAFQNMVPCGGSASLGKCSPGLCIWVAPNPPVTAPQQCR